MEVVSLSNLKRKHHPAADHIIELDGLEVKKAADATVLIIRTLLVPLGISNWY